MEKTGVPGENHLSAGSPWHTWSHNVASSGTRPHNLCGDRYLLQLNKERNQSTDIIGRKNFSFDSRYVYHLSKGNIQVKDSLLLIFPGKLKLKYSRSDNAFISVGFTLSYAMFLK